MRTWLDNKSSKSTTPNSAELAHARLLAIRGEKVVLPLQQNSEFATNPVLAPKNYCLLPSIRRAVLQINQIKSLPQTLPVFAGPPGSGKTALLSYLKNNFKEKSAVLNGTSGVNNQNLIKLIALSAGVSVPKPQINAEKSLDLLLGEISKNEIKLVLLVDRADSLSLSCLMSLIHLVAVQQKEVCLSVILFGSKDLSVRIESIANTAMRCINVETIPLNPLNNAEARMYIHACLKAFNTRANSFVLSHKVIENANKIAQGIPLGLQEIIPAEIMPHLKKEPNHSVAIISKITNIASSARVASFALIVLTAMILHRAPPGSSFYLASNLLDSYEETSGQLVLSISKTIVAAKHQVQNVFV